MAVTVAVVGTIPSSPIVPGTRRYRRCKVTFDTNYPSGGYALTAATFGLVSLDTVHVAGTTLLGRWASWDQGNSKLQLWKAYMTENDTADVSADSVIVTAVGL